MLERNPYLKKVIIVGPTEVQRSTIDGCYRSRVQFISEEDLLTEEGWKRFSKVHLKEPVYISIDKDVLNHDSAITDWDQGNICLDDLKRLLDSIFKNEKVIGMDICGEYSEAHDLIDAQEGGLHLFHLLGLIHIVDDLVAVAISIPAQACGKGNYSY